MSTNQINKIVVVDWSIICYNNWHRMKSPNYKAQSRLELEEFALAMARSMWEIKNRFEADDLILAIDTKIPWRTGYYQKYYDTHTHYWKNLTKARDWVVSFDNKYWAVTWSETTQLWKYKQLKKDEREQWEVDVQYTKNWMFFEYGKTPQAVLDAYPDQPKHVKECPDWDGLNAIVPGYKKSRPSTWNFETPKAEWKKHCRALAFNMAPCLNARPILVKDAEADDIAAQVCYTYQGHDIVLMTADQDWYQLAMTGPKTSIWDTYKNSWVKYSKEDLQYKLFAKLLGGDDSDDIPGVRMNGGNPMATVQFDPTGTIVKGGKNTIKFLDNALHRHPDPNSLHESFLASQTEDSYTRNFNLIHLAMMPQDIRERIHKALIETQVPTEPEYTISDFNFDDREQRLAERTAITYQLLDKIVRNVNTPDGNVRFSSAPEGSVYGD